jgi:hypothetical protein
MDIPQPSEGPHERALGGTRTVDRRVNDPIPEALRDLLRYAWRSTCPPLPVIVAANELLVDAGLPSVIPDCSHVDHNHFGYDGVPRRYGLLYGTEGNWEPCSRLTR